MAAFLPVVPNWRYGVRDSYEFLTEIVASRSGSEGRRAMRQYPRRKIEFTALADNERLRKLHTAYALGRDGNFEMPDYTAEAGTLAAATAGATQVVLTSVPDWFDGTEGDFAIVSGREARKVTVASVSDNTLTLSGPLATGVALGAQFRRLLEVTPMAASSLTLPTNDVGTANVAFEVKPGTDNLTFDDGDILEAAAFYGRYVLMRKPNYLRAPRMTSELNFDRVDYGRGVVKTFAPISMAQRTFSADYLAANRDQVRELLDVFLRAKGRLGEIYVPTWGNDFPAVTAVSGSTVTVLGSEMFDAYGDDLAHTAILVRLTDGQTVLPYEIEGMSLVGGNTVLALERTAEFSKNDVARISWMHVARFSADAFTVEWVTSEVAEITMTFLALKNLPVENLYGSNWILLTGQWRDLGQWEDTATWIDAL